MVVVIYSIPGIQPLTPNLEVNNIINRGYSAHNILTANDIHTSFLATAIHVGVGMTASLLPYFRILKPNLLINSAKFKVGAGNYTYGCCDYSLRSELINQKL